MMKVKTNMGIVCVCVVTVQPSVMPGSDTTDGGDVDQHADCVCTCECVCVCGDRATFSDVRW